MNRAAFWVFLVLAAVPAHAQSNIETFWYQQGNGAMLQGTVLNCATGQGRAAAPCGGMASPMNVLSAPFRRLHSAPIRLKALGPAPKSFPISRPADATTYRVVVPCDVDVRLLGTTDPAEQVTADTGVLYLARTEATMGTSRPTYISAMTVGTPTGDCTPEMHYGMGGG